MTPQMSKLIFCLSSIHMLFELPNLVMIHRTYLADSNKIYIKHKKFHYIFFAVKFFKKIIQLKVNGRIIRITIYRRRKKTICKKNKDAKLV